MFGASPLRWFTCVSSLNYVWKSPGTATFPIPRTAYIRENSNCKIAKKVKKILSWKITLFIIVTRLQRALKILK